MACTVNGADMVLLLLAAAGSGEEAGTRVRGMSPFKQGRAVYLARRPQRITLQSHFGGLFCDIILHLPRQNRFRRGISAHGQK
jgi:hypothetical protein